MWILIIIIPLLIWLDYHLFKIYFKLFFKDVEDFHNSIKYSFTPDLFSLFRGEYFKDRSAEFKLGVFIFLCIITILFEIMIVRGELNFI